MDERVENFWHLVSDICEQGKRRVLGHGSDALSMTSHRLPDGAGNADDAAMDDLTVELIANI